MTQNSVSRYGIFILSFTIIYFLFSCASHKKVNKLASQLNCNETIHFVFDEESKFAKIKYNGNHFGNSKYPDYKKTFKESVEELDKKSPAKMEYKDAHSFPSDSVVQVTVRIKKIVWNFGFSSALMETELIYKLSDRDINIIGNNKVHMAGTKRGNLFKSLKHGNYMFLSIICNE
ncbi:MAG: hypothetical protein WBG48_11700 [Pricia sp.]